MSENDETDWDDQIDQTYSLTASTDSSVIQLCIIVPSQIVIVKDFNQQIYRKNFQLVFKMVANPLVDTGIELLLDAKDFQIVLYIYIYLTKPPK